MVGNILFVALGWLYLSWAELRAINMFIDEYIISRKYIKIKKFKILFIRDNSSDNIYLTTFIWKLVSIISNVVIYISYILFELLLPEKSSIIVMALLSKPIIFCFIVFFYGRRIKKKNSIYNV